MFEAKFRKILLQMVCAGVLAGILTAGLWPFRAPRNQVRWLDGGGLGFGWHASVVSKDEFRAIQSGQYGHFSLEIWLQPARIHDGGTILTFYRKDVGLAPFALRQSWGNVVLRRRELKRDGDVIRVFINNLFDQERPVFVSMTAGDASTTVYANGDLVKRLPDFKFTAEDFTGRLLMGNSPTGGDIWSGDVKGLAIYGRELNAEEVKESYKNWTQNTGSAIAQGALAVYRFDENNGDVAHNRIEAGTDLVIPARFFALHQQFLETPWHEYRPGWSYWKYIVINIAGFVPSGFFFYAYFLLLTRISRPLLAAVIFGFAVSVTIEVLQAFLPTRDSGMTDIITNTLGTYLGVLLYKYEAVQARLRGAGLLPETRECADVESHSQAVASVG